VIDGTRLNATAGISEPDGHVVEYRKTLLPELRATIKTIRVVERTMKVEGNCHCGAIAYEAIVDPQKAGLCHCTDCQTLSGAPFRASVPALADDFRILRGQPKLYIKTAASGTQRAQAFCADCGTPIYAAAADNPTQFNLRLGAIVQRAQIPALKQSWCSSALAWAQNIANLPESPQR
jgi:hypothetical protein